MPARRVRFALVAAVVVPLGFVLLLGSAYAQFPQGPPGFPPGGMPGPGPGFGPGGLPPLPPLPQPPPFNPPNPGGVLGNMPGDPGAGILGNRPPGTGNLGNPPGGVFGNRGGLGGGGGLFERVWVCTGCGTELGRGGIRPSLDQCPGCQARIINGPNFGRVPNAGGGNPNPNPGGGRMFPPPQIQFENIWKCSRCGAEIGRGGDRPAFDQCPRCAAQIVNGPGGGLVNPPVGPIVNQPAGVAPGNLFRSGSGSRDYTALIVLGVLGGLAIAAGVVIGVIKACTYT